MSEKHINIISFDIPFPADYGGVIDVFYKIKSLHEQGIKIHLHCFEYGREQQEELNKYAVEVFYYPRNMAKVNLLSSKPFIVVSRKHEQLIENILNNNYPILFEGLHCCAYINDERLKNRLKIVRTHNIEHDYYSNLASVEKNWIKEYYFIRESRRLEKFESNLKYANKIATISKNDLNYFSSKYANCQHISAFHPNITVKIKPGKGDFALYHGNLGVGENNQAALFLVNQIFSDLNYPLIIAGNKASKELINAVESNKNARLISDVDNDTINQLIEDAQINILPTFQATGIKLKLLAALYRGRHCVVNSPMVKDTGLECLCNIEDLKDEMKAKIIELSKIDFTDSMIEKRAQLLNKDFSNLMQVEKLVKLIWN
ncbi:MAG: glycosyltransferase [Bacteroidota bacterium]